MVFPCECIASCFLFFFFLKGTATTEIYTRGIVGSVRCVQETGVFQPVQQHLRHRRSTPAITASREHDISALNAQRAHLEVGDGHLNLDTGLDGEGGDLLLSLIHISEPTRPLYISYAVFCLKKKKASPT
eukprot:TRINITY_DN18025_c0_g1_i2.p1 TRINITY_DN18025_c0_g1~~TRINITY_DN18025_c0_g1_i2.p1  ORF type:complete len:130 (-),score=35.09 TRINITY_DN18025_c0_g1_i2:54-443(-)